MTMMMMMMMMMTDNQFSACVRMCVHVFLQVPCACSHLNWKMGLCNNVRYVLLLLLLLSSLSLSLSLSLLSLSTQPKASSLRTGRETKGCRDCWSVLRPGPAETAQLTRPTQGQPSRPQAPPLPTTRTRAAPREAAPTGRARTAREPTRPRSPGAGRKLVKVKETAPTTEVTPPRVVGLTGTSKGGSNREVVEERGRRRTRKGKGIKD